MTKNTLFAGVAAISMALASTASFAQSTPSSPEQREAVPNNSSIEYNETNVTPERPFGQIDMSAAGTTEDSWRTFWRGLSPEQQTEMQNRCEYITENRGTFETADVEQCRLYMGNAEAEGSTSN